MSEYHDRTPPTDRIGASVDGIETFDGEVHGGESVCGMSNEFRHLIDAPSDQALLGQEVRPMTRATTRIDEVAMDVACPRRHDLEIRWMNRTHRAQQIYVLRRPAGVCSATRLVGHALKSKRIESSCP